MDTEEPKAEIKKIKETLPIIEDELSAPLKALSIHEPSEESIVLSSAKKIICPICLGTDKEADLTIVIFNPCQHKVCTDCLNQMI